MALIIKDRIKEGSTSTGTGDISLAGAAATFEPFSSYLSNGDTTYYAIVHTASGVDEWEVGLGTWNTGNTLTRTTVLSGSNGSSAVNFSAGSKDVFMTYPAEKAVYTDASGDIDINGGTIDGTTIGANSHTTGKFTTLQATGNVDFDGYIDMAAIDHPTHAEGRVYYDTNHKTLSYQSDVSDVEHELGIEEHVRVYNNTGSTIVKGKPVYWSGNQNDVPTIALGNAAEESKYNVQGLTAGDIASNSYGYVIVSGLVDGIDTSGLTAGQNVFMGLADGQLQNASPTYPNYPMCIGWVVKSDATDGIILVNQQNHSVNSFRVRTSAHIGDDLIVGGDLTVLGSQTIASSENVSIANAWNYFNSGDTIGALNTNFSGTGLNDASLTGHFTGPVSTTYYVRIDGVGTGTGGVDTFEWSTDNFATTVATDVDITGEDQLIHSTDNIAIKFEATTGHTLGDTWTGTAAPLAVDTGFATNRNTGSSGVGYTHMGIYYDVSTDKWTVFDEYDPEPEGTIDTSHASFNYGTLKAGTFEGALTGNVTGNLTGTATSANALATARTIGGVSFDGSANINLPGVNTTGNQDTTGNAATASALETARTISLSGDVTGSTSFDGSGNVSITATVQDDSHAHVIANVDGLQTALDGKTTTARTITAGSGLTGGGDLTANRTISHADTSTQASLTALTGAAVVSDVDLDTYGHVTNLSTRNMTLADLGYTGETNATADQTITAGGGLSGGGTGNITISHSDTSSQASVNNSGGTVIQDITLDTYGHITGINSTNLDGRYYTESEADSRFVNTSGDTMTGDLTFGSGDNIHRNTHSSGYLVGSYNSVGANSDKSNPIYTIGSGYQPSDTDLNNMYGIGYSNGNAAFDGINSVLGGWGLYVAADGNARIGLDGSSGIIRSTGVAYVNTNQRVFADNYHPNADKWTTARTLSLSGDASGSVSWDGSANATLSVTVANDSHTHDGRYYTESEADSRFVRKNVGYTWTATGNNALSFRSENTIDTGSGDQAALEVYQDNAGHDAFMQFHVAGDYGKYFGLHGGINDFVVGGWSHGAGYQRIFHDGYHPNADKWTTARTLSLSGDASGSVSWDGSSNATLSVTVANNSHTHTPSNISGLIEGTSFSGEYPVLFGVDSSTGRIFSESSITFRGSDSRLAIDGNTVWHSGNDGSGSGLDADLLDGLHESTFMRRSANSNLDMNNNDIVGVDQIIHEGDSNTYMQFHAADQWRVVTGGAERLEVNNSQVLASVVLRSTQDVVAYYSDERLKTKVSTIDNALEKVQTLEGFYYVENDLAREHGYTKEEQQVALSAQAVQAVMPEVVRPAPFDVGIDEEGNEYSKSGEDYLTVDYAKLVPLLVEAIKEQQTQIDELKAKLEV